MLERILHALVSTFVGNLPERLIGDRAYDYEQHPENFLRLAQLACVLILLRGCNEASGRYLRGASVGVGSFRSDQLGRQAAEVGPSASPSGG